MPLGVSWLLGVPGVCWWCGAVPRHMHKQGGEQQHWVPQPGTPQLVTVLSCTPKCCRATDTEQSWRAVTVVLVEMALLSLVTGPAWTGQLRKCPLARVPSADGAVSPGTARAVNAGCHWDQSQGKQRTQHRHWQLFVSVI